MTTISYADALKAFRRGVHQNGEGWRCVVLCRDRPQLLSAWDEARHILEAGSIPVEYCNVATRSIKAVGLMRFFIVPDINMAETTVRGQQATQLIWLFTPDDLTFNYVEHIKRSMDVKSGLRTDMSEY